MIAGFMPVEVAMMPPESKKPLAVFRFRPQPVVIFAVLC